MRLLRALVGATILSISGLRPCYPYHLRLGATFRRRQRKRPPRRNRGAFPSTCLRWWGLGRVRRFRVLRRECRSPSPWRRRGGRGDAEHGLARRFVDDLALRVDDRRTSSSSESSSSSTSSVTAVTSSASESSSSSGSSVTNEPYCDFAGGACTTDADCVLLTFLNTVALG